MPDSINSSGLRIYFFTTVPETCVCRGKSNARGLRAFCQQSHVAQNSPGKKGNSLQVRGQGCLAALKSVQRSQSCSSLWQHRETWGGGGRQAGVPSGNFRLKRKRRPTGAPEATRLVPTGSFHFVNLKPLTTKSCLSSSVWTYLMFPSPRGALKTHKYPDYSLSS